MKKSNLIIYAVIALGSVFLLWLWFYLGLSRIDSPLDLVLSIIWWAMVAVAIVATIQTEKRRQERIRTVYVSDKEVFNSEAGTLSFNDSTQIVNVIGNVLEDLKYSFTKNDLPEKERFAARYLVRTSKIDDDAWEGEVVLARTKRQTKFESREELADILTRI